MTRIDTQHPETFPLRSVVPVIAGGAEQETASWPARAYVSEDGELDEYDSRTGLARIAACPQLIALARALLVSDRDALKFIWVTERVHWMLVRMEAERGQPGGAAVLVEVIDIHPPYGLTLRELDVLTLLSAGFSNETIGARLSISPRTIAKHIENIFAKTGTWTRAGLAGLATDHGLLRLPTPGGWDGYPLGTGQIEKIAERIDSVRPKPQRVLKRRPIIVGMPLSLSGRGKADAQEMLCGAQLAVARLNERGGVLGREVQLMTVDCDLGDDASSLAAYGKLIDSEVDAITAGYSSSEPVIQDLVADFGGPYLHAATMDSVVDRVRNDVSRLGNIFQVCASDVNYGLGLARFLTDLELSGQWTPRNRRLVVLQPPWRGLNIGINELDRGIGRKGWQIEVVSDLPIGCDNWRPVMERLHRLDPCVIVVASYFCEDSIAFQKAFIDSPIQALVYNLYSPSIPEYRETLGTFAEGVLWATTTGLYSDRIGNEFSRAYRQRFGREPGQSHASIAFDRINILAGAWARVGSARQFKRVVGDLRSTIHRGVNGSYFFGTDGQVGLAFPDDTQDPSISQAHLVFQIQNGEQRILSPQPYANGRFILPRWMRGRA